MAAGFDFALSKNEAQKEFYKITGHSFSNAQIVSELCGYIRMNVHVRRFKSHENLK